MEERFLGIGELARRTGTKVQTIRYYEEIGLLPPPPRTAGNQRRYGRDHQQRLAFVRHARELGFSLEAIRTLLDLVDRPDQPCEKADAVARARLAEVESRLQRLQALKEELERMICECRGGRVAQCRVIEVLADHGHCLYADHGSPERRRTRRGGEGRWNSGGGRPSGSWAEG